MFEMRRLRVDKQARRNREGGPLNRIRRTGNAERTSEPHRASDQPGRQFRQPVELAGATSENHVPPPIAHDRACGQTVAHHFKNFLDAWFDDAHQSRARHQLRLFALMLFERRDRDQVRAAFDREVGRRRDERIAWEHAAEGDIWGERRLEADADAYEAWENQR